MPILTKELLERNYGHPKRWEAVLRRMPTGPIVGVEVGVFCGVMSNELLKRPDLHLWLVDVVIKDQVRNLPRTTVIEDQSTEAAKLAPNAYFDFVFIDANHHYLAVKEDIEAWLPKVKPGGWLCGHDYHKPYKCGGVKKAVEEAFAGRYELDGNDTWFVKV